MVSLFIAAPIAIVAGGAPLALSAQMMEIGETRVPLVYNVAHVRVPTVVSEWLLATYIVEPAAGDNAEIVLILLAAFAHVSYGDVLEPAEST